MSSSSAAALAGAGPRTNPGTLCRSRALASAGVALAAAKVPASADRAAAVSGPGGCYVEGANACPRSMGRRQRAPFWVFTSG